jgi:hypothetical protein
MFKNELEVLSVRGTEADKIRSSETRWKADKVVLCPRDVNSASQSAPCVIKTSRYVVDFMQSYTFIGGNAFRYMCHKRRIFF